MSEGETNAAKFTSCGTRLIGLSLAARPALAATTYLVEVTSPYPISYFTIDIKGYYSFIQYADDPLGHASPSITLDTYGHLFKGSDERVAESIDDAFSRALEQSASANE